jgi:hypothetical protein
MNNKANDEDKVHCMNLGELEPAFIIHLIEREASFLKDAAKFRGEQEGWAGHVPFWESAYMTEFGVHKALKEKSKRHRWSGIYFGDAAEASLDFIVWRKARSYTIGVSSRRHRDLVRFSEDPQQFYPYRRLRKSEKQIGDYIVSTSAITNDDGTITIAYWGAMTRRTLVTYLKESHVTMAHPSQGDYISIPLRRFSPNTLLHLIESLDDTD